MTDQLFITFGTRYTREPHPMMIHPDGVVVVEGDSYEDARQRAFAVTGGRFAFDYPIIQLEDTVADYYPLGVIGRIDGAGYHPIRRFQITSQEIL